VILLILITGNFFSFFLYLCQDIYFKKNVQEILDKFQMNNHNSMSALIEFGLKQKRNHEEKKVKNTFLQKIIRS